ncbi:MAG: hypothetical protein FJ271_28625 [Planctomycetes bacterium]|nr:hypothetical protein [Planctomycetota bacterium]
MVLEKAPAPSTTEPPATAITTLPPPGPSGPAPTSSKATTGHSRVPQLLHGLTIGMLLLLTFLLASFAIRNSDFFLRLATGRLIAQGEYQFGVDPFSFTTENVYWANPSWLYDLLVYLIHVVSGGVGLVLAKALLMVGVAWLMLRHRRPEQPAFVPVIVCALSIVVMSPRFLFQPMCVSLSFLGMTLLVLERSKRLERRLWLLPPMFLLWANIDGWFILGLLLAALYLLGEWIKGTDPARRKRLGMALLASLGCCLINPHLWRVFTLPPELAYLAAQASDTIGIGLPEWLIAPGRTWQVLHDNDAGFLLTLSPLAEGFRSLSGLGNNLAGLAYYALLLLGLASFVPTFLRGAEQQRSWSRLAIWLPVALLSLTLARTIGFFAVVTGPVVILNLEEALAARAARGRPLPGRPALAGAVTMLLLAGLLILAWPGWINGPLENFNSARRVGWGLEPDESFRQAAERLDRLHMEGKTHGGAALSIELANYLPWFAPGVKGFCDSRFELFPAVIDEFFRIRRALSQDSAEYFAGKAVPLDDQFQKWRELAKRHQLDFVALTNYQGAQVTQQLSRRFWLSPALWPSLYGDGRTVVFGWNPGKADRFAGERIDWNRAAFGKVPEMDRPPARGAPPPEDVGFVEKYVNGVPPTPLEVSETLLLHSAYQFFGQYWARYYFPAWQVGALASTAGSSAAVPGIVSVQPNMLPFLTLFASKYFAPMLRPEDGGPPALPVLMVRASRRGVAQAPRSPDCYLNLADACKTLWLTQESHWALDRGQERLEASYMRSIAPHSINYLNLRNMLRRVQLIAALKSCLRLDPDNWRVHEILGEIYTDVYFLDVALEHYAEAANRFQRRRPSDPKLVDTFREKLEQLQSIVKRYNEGLQKRKADFDLRASGKNSLKKYALALRSPYKALELNKDQTDPRGMGLARDALFALQSAALGQAEDFFVVTNQLDMLLLLGEVSFVGEVLAKAGVQKLLGPSLGYYQTLWAAAIGDYQQARAALTRQIEETPISSRAADIRGWLLLKMAPAQNIAELAGQAHWFLSERDGVLALGRILQPVANLHLVRGLLALEQGDTAAALGDFQTCLDMTGAVFLHDRFIAERYLALLKGQR